MGGGVGQCGREMQGVRVGRARARTRRVSVCVRGGGAHHSPCTLPSLRFSSTAPRGLWAEMDMSLRRMVWLRVDL